MRISKTRSTRTIKTSGAVTATSQSTAFDVGTGEDLSIMLDVGTVSGTTPSMTVSIHWSNDGATWYNADPGDSFTAITTTGTRLTRSFTVKGLYARLNYAISGTTPSFTFAAYSIIGD